MPTEFTPMHDRFEALAEQLTAPGPIDVDKALAQGGRTRAHRRARSTGIAVTSVVATAALALIAVNFHTAAPPARSIVSPQPAAVRTATDPIAVGVSFGWLPTGMNTDGYSQQPAKNGSDAFHDLAETGTSDSPVLDLVDAPAGPRPTPSFDITPPMPAAFAAGPPINGHKSFVASVAGDGASPLGGLDPYYLLWQFDDGRWAILYVQSDPKNVLSAAETVRVAEGVTEKPFPIPQYFQIDGSLAAADVVAAAAQNSGVKLTLRAGSAEIEITAEATKNAGPNCKTAPDSPLVACVTVHGELSPPLAAEGVRGILSDIKLLEFPTTDVIL